MSQHTDNTLTLRVLAAIQSHTEKNPITGGEIARRYGTDIRKVAAIVSEARANGLKIGSSKQEPRGYFLATHPSELEGTLLHMEAEAKETLRVVGRLRDWNTLAPTIWEQGG